MAVRPDGALYFCDSLKPENFQSQPPHPSPLPQGERGQNVASFYQWGNGGRLAEGATVSLRFLRDDKGTRGEEHTQRLPESDPHSEAEFDPGAGIVAVNGAAG